ELHCRCTARHETNNTTKVVPFQAPPPARPEPRDFVRDDQLTAQSDAASASSSSASGKTRRRGGLTRDRVASESEHERRPNPKAPPPAPRPPPRHHPPPRATPPPSARKHRGPLSRRRR